MYKKIFLLVVLAFLFCNADAQKTEKSEEKNSEMSNDHIPAEFAGGVNQWIQYLQQNLNADLGAKYIKMSRGQKRAVQTAIVLFTIDTSGNVTNVSVENAKDIHPKLAAEAIRVMQASPKWKPAVQYGRKVIFRHKQNISFAATVE